MQEVCGVFATLDAVEGACHQLEARGITRSQLTLDVAESCAACAREETLFDRENHERLGIGRGFGALAGAGLGLLALLGTQEAAIGLFSWVLHLFVLASWSLSGSLLGGLIAVTLDEAREALRRSRRGDHVAHAHAVLKVAVAPDAAEDVRTVLTRRGGRILEGTPACVRG